MKNNLFKRIIASLLVASMCFMGVGCMSKNTDTSVTAEPLLSVSYPEKIAYDDFNGKAENKLQNVVDPDFLEDVNDFAYKTAGEVLKNSDGNISYSPISLYYALALATTGANGETANELYNLLDVDTSEELSQNASKLYRQLYFENEIGSLKIANSLWLNDKLEVKEPFIQNAAENFYASVYSVNFKDKNLPQLMSKWVKDNVNGTIEPQINIDKSQIMSILNTIYFYDEWVHAFDSTKTEKDVFHINDKDTVDADFMNKEFMSSVFYTGDNFSRASLALKNGSEMTFVLPDESVSIYDLVKNDDTIEDILEDGKRQVGKVTWKIPKFKTGSELSLVEVLKSLGITSAFNENADFSNITDEKAFISDIKQQTHIAIDEKGVEASAFTNISFATSMMPISEIEMKLDRPFLYAIRDTNGTVLFIGICTNPIA